MIRDLREKKNRASGVRRGTIFPMTRTIQGVAFERAVGPLDAVDTLILGLNPVPIGNTWRGNGLCSIRVPTLFLLLLSRTVNSYAGGISVAR